MSRLFIIIGAGSGQAEDLTRQAREAMVQCGLLLASERLAHSLHKLADIQPCAASQLAQTALAADDAHVGILVSGDAGFFGAAKTLQAALQEYGEVRLICGISSMQLLCAKLCVSYDDVLWLSLHGRKGSLIGAVSYHKRVFALTSSTNNAQKLCQSLTDAGLGGVRVSIGENLGAPAERILTGSAEELSKEPCGDLAVLLVENDFPGAVGQPVLDSQLEHGTVSMLPQEVRWTAVNLLDLHPDDVAYDIHAGVGAVSMEMARRVPRGLVYAIEPAAEGIWHIERNRKAMNCWNALVVEGEAPDAMRDLPTPDAAFLSGSGTALYETLAQLKERNADIRVVIAAASLEMLSDAQIALNTLEFAQTAVSQMQAVRGQKENGRTALQMQNPVYLLYGGPQR